MDLIKLKIPSCPTQIDLLEELVSKVICDCAIDQEIFPNILISLTEAVNNAIIHGNNNDVNKYVNIRFKQTDSRLIFTISDEGNGFNPNRIPDPTSPERIAECGGRGVYIMKELSDNMNYKNNGSTVELEFLNS